MSPYSVAATAAIVAILAWAFMHGTMRRKASMPYRSSMVARLTVIYMDRSDNWKGTYAYFEAPDFNGCRKKAITWLRVYSRGETVSDLYSVWPPSRHDRELVGADLADEFRSLTGESITYTFQPHEWS